MVQALVKRNTLVFWRDRSTVFFSFLSTLILIALYFFFITNLYTDAMDVLGTETLTFTLTNKAKNFIVYLQMMAGVLILNSISLATGVFSTIAKDFENHRVASFLLTPIKPSQLIVSYFITGLLVSFGFNILAWLISIMVIKIATGFWIAITTFLVSLIVLFITSLISCAFMLLITTLVKSSVAIGVINGTSGVFVGFLSGIYMPYINLGTTTERIGSLLPFSHLTIWLKQIVLGDAFFQSGIPRRYADILCKELFSAENIGFLTMDVPLEIMIIGSGFLGLVCLGVAYLILGKRLKNS